jgi:hypothetical protein
LKCFLLKSYSLTRREAYLEVCGQDDVRATPRVIANHPPAMSGARRIFRKQHITGTNDKPGTVTHFEFERSAKREYELMRRRGMPIEGITWLGFAERDRRRVKYLSDQITFMPARKRQITFFKT